MSNPTNPDDLLTAGYARVVQADELGGNFSLLQRPHPANGPVGSSTATDLLGPQFSAEHPDGPLS